MMHHAAATQDADQVGAAKHFTDAMCHEANADTAGSQVTEAAHQSFHFARSKERGRLIQQKESSVLCERNQQFAHLALDDTEPLSRHIEGDADPGALRRCLKL